MVPIVIVTDRQTVHVDDRDGNVGVRHDRRAHGGGYHGRQRGCDRRGWNRSRRGSRRRRRTDTGGGHTASRQARRWGCHSSSGGGRTSSRTTSAPAARDRRCRRRRGIGTKVGETAKTRGNGCGCSRRKKRVGKTRVDATADLDGAVGLGVNELAAKVVHVCHANHKGALGGRHVRQNQGSACAEDEVLERLFDGEDKAVVLARKGLEVR